MFYLIIICTNNRTTIDCFKIYIALIISYKKAFEFENTEVMFQRSLILQLATESSVMRKITCLKIIIGFLFSFKFGIT